MNINEARLVSFVSAQTNHEFDCWELERLINYVQACQLEHEKVEVIKEVPAPIVGYGVFNTPDNIGIAISNIIQAIKKGWKIEAIKAVRTLSALGLKEAKDLVEANWIDFEIKNKFRDDINTLVSERAVLREENKSLKNRIVELEVGWATLNRE